jgi:hypothetical protein
VPSAIYLPRQGLLGSLIGARFDITGGAGDQPIALSSSRCRITDIIVAAPSTNFSTLTPAANGGFYTGPFKTGNVIVAAAQTYATLVTSIDWKALTLDAYALAALVVVPTIYFSLSNSCTAPALVTADIFVFGEKYD